MEVVLVTSASLVAVIVSVPGTAGAVYIPEELIWPFTAVHVTDLSVVVPVMVAVSCSEPPAVADAVFGVMAMDVTADPLSPLPSVGVGVGLGGFDALPRFAVAAEPAQPPVPKDAASSKDVIAKLVVQTAFLKTQIMKSRDSLSIKFFYLGNICDQAGRCRCSGANVVDGTLLPVGRWNKTATLLIFTSGCSTLRRTQISV
jgi:hypothetical protein